MIEVYIKERSKVFHIWRWLLSASLEMLTSLVRPQSRGASLVGFGRVGGLRRVWRDAALMKGSPERCGTAAATTATDRRASYKWPLMQGLQAQQLPCTTLGYTTYSSFNAQLTCLHETLHWVYIYSRRPSN